MKLDGNVSIRYPHYLMSLGDATFLMGKVDSGILEIEIFTDRNTRVFLDIVLAVSDIEIIDATLMSYLKITDIFENSIIATLKRNTD